MGLFGQNPYDSQAAEQAAMDKQAMDMAKMSQDEMSSYAMAKGGLQAGRGVRGLIGIEDPALQELKIGKEMMQGVDLTDPKALKDLAKAYAAKGLHRFGEEAYNKAVALEKAALETGKTQAEIGKINAEATAKGMPKQSAADSAARRAAVIKVEQRLLNGEDVSDKDPDMVAARAALAVETRPQSIKNEDGSITQVPGINAGDYAPNLFNRLRGGGVTSPAPSSTGSVAADGTYTPTEREAADLASIDREIARVQKSNDPKNADSLLILQNERAKILQGRTAPVGSVPAASAAPSSTTIQTPTSIANAVKITKAKEERDKGLEHALQNVAKARSLIGPTSTGWGALLFQNLPNTDAMAMADAVTSLKSEQVLGQLTALKEASKTGASGLGQLTEKEIPLLESRIRSLNPKSKTFPADLAYIEKTWKTIQQELRAGTSTPAPATSNVNYQATLNNVMKKYNLTAEQAAAALAKKGITQ